MKQPFSWEKAICYHLYIRSFKDSNNDGIGDLPGITEKLDYLKETLGIDVVWISPFYPSPMIDFGYDISDYTGIDPQFGTLSDFDVLIREAHKKDIRIMMDFVPNHTSDQHPWFLASQSSKTNPKRDWYIWRDPKPDGSPPNNWVGVFGGSTWQYDQKTKQYYLHSFAVEQPDLNWENPEVIQALQEVLRFWLKRGVDGIRVDAVNHIFKDYTFPDEPLNPNYVLGTDREFSQLIHLYSKDVTEQLVLLKHLCNTAAEFPGTILVTEAYLSLSGLLEYYHVCDENLIIPFNFFMLRTPWDAKEYKNFLDAYEQGRRVEDIGNFVLSNHDNPRVASRLGEKRSGVAAMLLFTLRGIPFIYYGDEIGMTNGKIPRKYLHDPLELNHPGLGLGRDPARTPMQWNAEKNAGFSQTVPWLPVAKSYHTYNVASELGDPFSMLSLYRSLIALRKASPALMKGKYIPLSAGDDVLAFARKEGQTTLLIIANFSKETKRCSLPFSKGKILLRTDMKEKEKEKELSLTSFALSGDTGYILEVLSQ